MATLLRIIRRGTPLETYSATLNDALSLFHELMPLVTTLLAARFQHSIELTESETMEMAQRLADGKASLVQATERLRKCRPEQKELIGFHIQTYRLLDSTVAEAYATMISAQLDRERRFREAQAISARADKFGREADRQKVRLAGTFKELTTLHPELVSALHLPDWYATFLRQLKWPEYLP